MSKVHELHTGSSAVAPSGHHRSAETGRRHVPAGRALHIVDLENLMGGPMAGFLPMAKAAAAYYEAVSVGEDDHLVVAVNPCLALDAHDCFPSALLRVRGGHDGADLALLEAIDDAQFVCSRYTRLIVGSGDGIFASAMLRLRLWGLLVGVVSRKCSLSASLRDSASFVRLLPDDFLPEVAA